MKKKQCCLVILAFYAGASLFGSEGTLRGKKFGIREWRTDLSTIKIKVTGEFFMELDRSRRKALSDELSQLVLSKDVDDGWYKDFNECKNFCVDYLNERWGNSVCGNTSLFKADLKSLEELDASLKHYQKTLAKEVYALVWTPSDHDAWGKLFEQAQKVFDEISLIVLSKKVRKSVDKCLQSAEPVVREVIALRWSDATEKRSFFSVKYKKCLSDWERVAEVIKDVEPSLNLACFVDLLRAAQDRFLKDASLENALDLAVTVALEKAFKEFDVAKVPDGFRLLWIYWLMSQAKFSSIEEETERDIESELAVEAAPREDLTRVKESGRFKSCVCQ